MVPFAGYEMPVQYPLGVLKEHLFCREHCGLFDVSHMGQLRISGGDQLALVETITTGEFLSIPCRFTRSEETRSEPALSDPQRKRRHHRRHHRGQT